MPATAYRRRWGDNDLNLGPFTFAGPANYKHTAIMLSSGDDEGSSAAFRISLHGWTAILALPRWLVPTERRWVDTSRHQWSHPGGGYWNEMRREYGFSLNEGHFGIHYGRQTHDSSTEQSWGCFLPWTQWRHVRHSLYGLDGAHFIDLPEYGLRLGAASWEEHHRLEESCPTVAFTFTDFDGEMLSATTKIGEREWRLGTKWCKWLSVFANPKVRRALDIRFSGETGRRKGSWKGGTLGAGIDMLPGELHEAAFRRYCASHDMTFIA